MQKTTTAIFAWAALTLAVTAEVPMDGTFTAAQACPAYQSINRQTNPGQVTLEPGQTYDRLAANRTPATYYLLVVPGASPERRWVAVTCGAAPGASTTPDPVPTTRPYRGTQYVLAVNWQPAFCETSGNKPECRRQTPSSFEASNFTLHGLWPQPRSRQYCDVSARDQQNSENGNWRDLPAISLPSDLRRELDKVMPGTQSGLDRHEWTRHGTCYGTGQAAYYADALDLMEALNRSAVADLFADNVGRRLTVSQVRAAFDKAFGDGSGQRVQMDCASDGNRQIITELTIGLTGTISGFDDLGRLIANADPTQGGCAGGMVDAVGLR